ncbi:M56 family metallopeptidase [Rhodococcus kroppenstedtii]|uniref:M56 family metallopeptidase n=1 Tax=Rhodococcoides kroppenstedtii TaxID=293050 RepID=UPI001C9B2CB4|nr:M56 family metallopeptidase [Rhodococcus kroppenstedtii]MBY6438468.1 M56 family metallopeptidase [Rhodococcus kroppenstedtii]
MTLAAIMLAAAALISLAAPPLLRVLSRAGLPPDAGIAAWLGSMCGALFFPASAVLVSFWPAHAPAESAVEAVARCWSVLSHDAETWLTVTVCAILSVGLGAAVARGAVFGHRSGRRNSRLRARHRALMSVVARSEGGVMWLDHPIPLAYSISGRPGLVVATDGLAARLSSSECQAVLAHERAHLKGGHHRILAFCAVMAATLPRLPLFAAAPPAVGVLVELTADQHAARATSADAVRTALVAMTAPSTAGRPRSCSSGDTSMRLRSLAVHTRPRWSRLLCAAASAVFTVAPVLLVLIGVGAVSAIVC